MGSTELVEIQFKYWKIFDVGETYEVEPFITERRGYTLTIVEVVPPTERTGLGTVICEKTYG